MCTPLFCGTFHHQQELVLEECMEPWSPSRKNHNGISIKSSSKDSKNPYSNRGLDKFSALLADLDDKRQKIFTQKGSEDISFLWFVYSNSNRCRPVVVKLKDKRNMQQEKPNGKQRDSGASAESDRDARKKILSRAISMKIDNLKRPSYYLPLIIVVVLLLIALFGRSFAVMCTSVGWYLVPDIVGSESSRPNKKKD